jgi:maltose alpha-D-glucosyltransferase / alpha-amylase
MSNKETLLSLWVKLYPTDKHERLDTFFEQLDSLRKEESAEPSDWYKQAVVYSLYVDLYNRNFAGLSHKLDYLQGLGVSCLWLLPILDSPMRDAGFDIRDYELIRHDLLGLEPGFSRQEQEAIFGDFLAEAHKRGLKVIFDIAMNHISDEHPWFVAAKSSEDNPFRDYFIWTKDTSLYGDARLLFKGMENSNWEPLGDWNYFHRFFSFQPDLNYRNPEVLLAMTHSLLYWQSLGVDGFRADAIPYLWKEEGTDCENLPNTHTIVKFFRAALDYVKPGTILLAEACQKPQKLVKYLGSGDECHAAYHFPLMPQMYKAIAMQKAAPVIETLSPEVTPPIPDSAQWFTFLRCHDELSLELVYVSEEDRKYIHENYCRQPEWDFRLGEGISARLANLMDFDDRRIALAFSIMLSLPGTPVIYYGDEFGKENDENYYREMIHMTGKNDTRFLVRGKIDWKKRETQLADPHSFQSKVFTKLQQLLKIRHQHPAFGHGSLEFVQLTKTNGEPAEEVLAYRRIINNDHMLIVQNLSEKIVETSFACVRQSRTDLLTGKQHNADTLLIEPLSYYWFSCK